MVMMAVSGDCENDDGDDGDYGSDGNGVGDSSSQAPNTYIKIPCMHKCYIRHM